LPAGGMRIGVLTNNLSVFLQALESVTNTTVLSNPKVLALDKQKGEVNVGAQLGYKTTTTSSTTTTETVAFLPTGTRLIFRPFIGDDGFIRLEIHPEDSSGTIDAAGVPQVTTTEVTSNVMVKDGHTIVIGGLFRDVSSASRGQVPGIGNIPFLGALFRQQQDSTQREEVIILLTPHIIKDDAAYSALSEEQQKRIEDYRVGVRKGMMIWGRERLAETAYQNALASLREPNPNRGMAMWHLNNATNLNPQFVEAMELKEKISGREVTASDNSSIRQFVSKAIISDQGTLQTPPPVMDIMPRRSTTMPTSTAGVATSQPAAVTPVAAVPIMEQFPATQPTTEPSLVELTDATTQPTSQPAVAEDDGGTAPTSTVTAISDDASAQPATQPSGGDELVRAAKALAEAAGHMANAADDLAHYAEVQPGHAKPSAMPTTRRTSKPSNGGTVTVVPLDDGNGN
ncbi:MAG TPA: hypothetical protein VLI90_15725, partial [Tepidisphaeraceae bacterium]|nr:hypothetical protein [Tepidisphaeraceae bacterium]